MRKVFFYLILILLPFLMIEGFFRLLPVSSPPYILPVTSENPVARFQPNIDYRVSVGWNFPIRTRNHSNNFGYSNLRNYHPDETTPLLMVIGDSQVEAHHVDSGKSAAEIVNASVNGVGRAYSIGLSGAPLSQYLVFAEFAKLTFRPNAMVFVVIGNDFDESLLKYKSDARFHYFQERGDHFELKRIDYKLSTTKRILRKSAFVRYVVLNLSIKGALKRLHGRLRGESKDYVGNMPASVENERIVDSKGAIREFFRRLPNSTGLDSQSVLFVIDGLRPALYSPQELSKAEGSYVSQMRKYFKEQAVLRGYEVVDMQPVFIDRHKLDGSRFEFEIDGHWNELGHTLVAEEIRRSAIVSRMFGN